MEKNTQLPVEVVNEIEQQADSYADKYMNGRVNTHEQGLISEVWTACATAYVIKLHQVEQENADLKRWKKEQITLFEPLYDYGMASDEIRLGESIVTFILNRCKAYDKIKAPGDHLTPGAPTTTGTYFAVLKRFAGDGDDMVVLQYWQHKNKYYAYGALSRPVKAEDIIGHVAREGHGMGGMRWVNVSKRLPENDMHMDYPREYCLMCKCDGSRGAVEYKQGNFSEIQDLWQNGPYDVIWWLDERSNANHSTPAGREEDRNEFAEWANSNYQRCGSEMKWMARISNRHEMFTTAELYELFKQQKV